MKYKIWFGEMTRKWRVTLIKNFEQYHLKPDYKLEHWTTVADRDVLLLNSRREAIMHLKKIAKHIRQIRKPEGENLKEIFEGIEINEIHNKK